VTIPLERLPDLPRVVVARIEGRDTLYEFDLTGAPSLAWRAVFFGHRPLSRPLTIPPTLAALRTVHFRAAPQPRGDWLRRIDQWIAYVNSVVEV
jgi:hypothetical protein